MDQLPILLTCAINRKAQDTQSNQNETYKKLTIKLHGGVPMQRSLQNLQLDLQSPEAPLLAAAPDRPGAGIVPVNGPESVPSPLTRSHYCDVNIDHEAATLWIYIEADAPSKFTPELVADLARLHDDIESHLDIDHGSNSHQRLRYQVLGSRIPGIFSLGGDLALFRECITSGDAHTLSRYAQATVSLVHSSADAYDSKLTTIALVQGQALGGGFEAALAAQVIVAERSAGMAFPEVLFNMFPGMGAYQLLCRRLSRREAEQIILSGRTYSALELHALGVVDVLAEDGEGEAAVRRYIRTHDRQHHARKGFHRALKAASPLDIGELRRMAEIWVETAMGLSPRDLDTIDYLLRAQERQHKDIAQAYTDALVEA
jgi:DSF synthase